MMAADSDSGAGVPYLIFNIATLRYRFGTCRGSISAMASTGEMLGVADLDPRHSDREAAFVASDAALQSGCVQRDGIRYPVGFYFPVTREVCIGGVPRTATYGDQTPLDIDPEGVEVNLVQNGIQAGERILPLVTATLATTSRRILVHQERGTNSICRQHQDLARQSRAAVRTIRECGMVTEGDVAFSPEVRPSYLCGATADRGSRVRAESISGGMPDLHAQNQFERVAVVPSGVIIVDRGEHL